VVPAQLDPDLACGTNTDPLWHEANA